MTGECRDCAHWTTRRETLYENGERIVTFEAPEGQGKCSVLSMITAPDFGCNKFMAAQASSSHVEISQKDGAPWQHWKMIPCPDCAGAGSSNDRPDDRCAGTGQVRLYDDGHVGDERTRVHPRERPPKISCASCGAALESGWKACPACGHRAETPAATEQVGGLTGGTV